VQADTGVLVREDRIIDVAPFSQLVGRLEPGSYDVKDSDLVMPGLINAHHHARVPTPVLMGCPDDFLEPWLLALKGLPPANGRLVTQASSIRQLRSGVTTVVHSDGPSAPSLYESLVHDRIEGYAATGQRVAFAVGYTDQNNWVYAPDETFIVSLPPELQAEVRQSPISGTGFTPAVYEDMFRRIERWARSRLGDLTHVLVGPLSPLWCSRESLEMMSHLCRTCGTGLHSHLLESVYQRQHAVSTIGTRVVPYLRGLDLLSARTSFAHAVWVTDSDIIELAETGTTVVHCPSSNLRLRCGIAPVIPMIRAGLPVALGLDANALDDDDDLFREARLASCIHFHPALASGHLSLANTFRMIFHGGARAALWEEKIGALRPGWQADIIGLSTERARTFSRSDSAGLFPGVLQRLRADDVRWVMVAGREVVRDGHFLKCDETVLLEELASEVAKGLSQASRNARFVERVRPYLFDFYLGEEAELGQPFYRFNGSA